MNCAPNTDGVLSDAVVESLEGLGELIEKRLSDNFPIQAPMIRDRARPHPQRLHPLHQRRHLTRPVQQRITRVHMQMHKRRRLTLPRLAHGTIIPRPPPNHEQKHGRQGRGLFPPTGALSTEPAAAPRRRTAPGAGMAPTLASSACQTAPGRWNASVTPRSTAAPARAKALRTAPTPNVHTAKQEAFSDGGGQDEGQGRRLPRRWQGTSWSCRRLDP